MAEAKTAKHTVTNVSGGPRVLNALPNAILLAAGEKATVEMTEAEATAAIVSEWFDFGKTKAD